MDLGRNVCHVKSPSRCVKNVEPTVNSVKKTGPLFIALFFSLPCCDCPYFRPVRPGAVKFRPHAHPTRGSGGGLTHLYFVGLRRTWTTPQCLKSGGERLHFCQESVGGPETPPRRIKLSLPPVKDHPTHLKLLHL